MKVFRNILGALVGIVVYFAAGLLLHLIIGMIFNSLSANEYVSNGIVIGSAVAGLTACSAISVPNRYGVKTGIVFLGCFYMLLGLINFISQIVMFNLSFADIFNSLMSFRSDFAFIWSEITLVIIGVIGIKLASANNE